MALKIKNVNYTALLLKFARINFLYHPPLLIWQPKCNKIGYNYSFDKACRGTGLINFISIDRT